MQSLAMIENWPVPTAAAAVVTSDGTLLGTHGPTAHRFPLASVTKPLAAYAALVAYEEGAVELDEPAGPEGSTVRHLLAHTSGLASRRRWRAHPPRTASRRWTTWCGSPPRCRPRDSSTRVRSWRPRPSSTPASRACSPATAIRTPTTGVSASRSATPSRRTGQGFRPPPPPSATSASPARSCGSTRRRARPASR
ncbi:hypothetical protein EAO68_32250 [Streptomyces sp. wa22]|nr:hypothetical protein EAO68_32250 [Streptomyces sp. wa22]